MTFALLERVAPSLTAAVRVIGESPLVPALPLITRRDATEAELDALRTAWADLPASVLEPLCLAGFDLVPYSEYGAIDALETEAARLGYPVLG